MYIIYYIIITTRGQYARDPIRTRYLTESTFNNACIYHIRNVNFSLHAQGRPQTFFKERSFYCTNDIRVFTGTLTPFSPSIIFSYIQYI